MRATRATTDDTEQSAREGEAAKSAGLGRSRPDLLSVLGLWVPAIVLLANIVLWLSTVQGMGGPEVLVRRADFVSGLTGATLIHDGNGQRLYDLQTQHNAQAEIFKPYLILGPDDLLPYNHLPFEALAISPLIGLAYPFILLVWSLVMAVALGLALWVLSKALPIAGQAGLIAVLAACSFQPVIRSFTLGQNSPLVLLGLCSLFAYSRKGNEVWAGASLLLVALKPQILPVVLLFLLLQGRWKTVGAFVAFLAALCIVIMPLLGPTWPVDYAKLLLGVANWGNVAAIDPAIMHNWRGFATNLFSGWAPALATPLFALLSLASVGLLVYVWFRIPRHDSSAIASTANQEFFDLMWALVVIIALLTSLHLNPHDLTLLILPGWIIVAYVVSGRWDPSLSHLWLWILWLEYALVPLTFFLVPVSNPALQTIPDILLMASAALLLTFQLTRGKLKWQEA